MTAPARATKPRNAAASRDALLASAKTLFSERGFDNTTVRDIGEAAGVDPALIARYFGSKVNLYLATVTAEDADSGRPEDLETPAQLVEWFVARVDARGPGAVMQALVRSDSTPEIREAARDHLTRRLVQPLSSMLERRGVADPRVRAELAVSALVGVLLARKLGSFTSLRELDRRQLVDVLTAMLPDLS
jgi:AcrR family transcriptional regulator